MNAMPLREAGAGRPIVLLHGWACHGGFWQPQLDGLSDRFRVIAPDLPGHGSSQTVASPLSIAALSDALHGLIARLERPILVGWSMGATVAFDYLRRFGAGQLGGLVIEDMTPRVLNGEDWSLGLSGGFDATLNALMVAAMRRNWAGQMRLFPPRLFARGAVADAGVLAWAGAALVANDPETMATLWESMAAQDYRADLPGFGLPALVVHGGASQLYAPDVASYLAAALPRSERVCFPHAGHTPHLEEPEAFNALLARFAG